MPEPSPEFDAAWARFQTLDRLVLGPETLESAWAHGRDRYAALLIPVDDPATVAHIHGVLPQVGDIPGVEPPGALLAHHDQGHRLRLRTRDGSDEVSPLTSRRCCGSHVTYWRHSPCSSAAGCINAFAEVVLLEVWDGGRVRDLNTRVLEAVPGIIRQPFDGALFSRTSASPASLARGTAPAEAVLGSCAGPARPPFTVGHIDLISAHLSAAAPTLERRRYELPSGR
jgi:hypothetical protein